MSPNECHFTQETDNCLHSTYVRLRRGNIHHLNSLDTRVITWLVAVIINVKATIVFP